MNATGRDEDRVGSDDRFMRFPRWLWHSPSVSAASPASRALVIELLSMFNGTNNGSLFLSVRDATDRLGASDFRVALNAFEELQQLGLIRKTFVDLFDKGRRAIARQCMASNLARR